MITRYYADDEFVFEGNNMLQIREKIDTSMADTDNVYTVKEGDNLRDIAHKRLGDARLYWVIADFNKIIDPFEKLSVGKALRMPSLKRVRENYL